MVSEQEILEDTKTLVKLVEDFISQLRLHFSFLPGEVDNVLDFMELVKRKYQFIPQLPASAPSDAVDLLFQDCEPDA